MLERTLHFRSASVAFEARIRERNSKLSKRFWWLNADQFMARQLNSRLPVSYTVKGRDTRTSAAPAEVINASDNLWALRMPGSSISLLEDSGWTVSLETPQSAKDAELERGGGPSASGDLSFLCREYAKTCKDLLAAATEGKLERRINDLPVVRFVLGELAKLASTKEALLVDPLNEFDDALADELSHSGSTGRPAGDDSVQAEVLESGACCGLSLEDLMGEVSNENLRKETCAKTPATWALAMYMGERCSDGSAPAPAPSPAAAPL